MDSEEMKTPWIKRPAWLDDADVRAAESEFDRRARRHAPAKVRSGSSAGHAATMLHGVEAASAGELGAVWRSDGPEVFEMASPAAALQGRENPPEIDRTECFAMALAYAFGEGPHPAHVIRRVFDLALELRPKMVGELVSAEALHLARGRDPLAHRSRVETVLAGTRYAQRSARVHERIILDTLRLAIAKRASDAAQFRAIELGELLAPLPGEELREFELRMATLRGFLGFWFDGGADAGLVARRVFSIAKWRQTTSALIHDMTLEHLGLLFGEVRATWSWRVKQTVNRMFRYRGARGAKASFQKSDSACAVYAEAQQGNRNRIGGTPIRAVG